MQYTCKIITSYFFTPNQLSKNEFLKIAIYCCEQFARHFKFNIVKPTRFIHRIPFNIHLKKLMKRLVYYNSLIYIQYWSKTRVAILHFIFIVMNA